jgi:hypothetical protein
MSSDILTSLAAADLKNFVTYNVRAMGHTPHQLQYLIADFFQGARPEWIASSKVLLGFRYLTKTFMVRQYCKWRWLRNPQTQIIVHSSTRNLAKRFAKAILQSLRQDPLVQHLAPGPEAGEYEWNLGGVLPEQGFSLQCAGIKTSLTGSRADVYIFDDPEPDDEPEALHDRIIRSFEEARFILHPPTRWLEYFRRRTGRPELEQVPPPERTQLLVVGQPHTEATAYVPPSPEIDSDGDGHPLANARFLRVPAVDSRGRWLWPQRYYSKRMARVLAPGEVARGFTKRTWRLQMLLSVTPEHAGEIIDLRMVPRSHRLVANPGMVVDPADGRNCEWGVCVGGLVGNQIHVQEMMGFHGEAFGDDPADEYMGESAWARVFDLAEDLDVRWVLIEKNLKAARTACRRYLSKRKLKIAVYEHASVRSKHRRIVEALEHPIPNGMVTFEPHLLSNAQNARQITGVTYSRLPEPNDRVDALAMLIHHFVEYPGLATVRDPSRMTGPRVREVRMSQTYQNLRITKTPYERLRRGRT